MNSKLAALGLGVCLFGAWALNFTDPPLQILGVVIFLVGLLHPVIEVLVAKIIQICQGRNHDKKPQSSRNL